MCMLNCRLYDFSISEWYMHITLCPLYITLCYYYYYMHAGVCIPLANKVQCMLWLPYVWSGRLTPRVDTLSVNFKIQYRLCMHSLSRCADNHCCSGQVLYIIIIMYTEGRNSLSTTCEDRRADWPAKSTVQSTRKNMATNRKRKLNVEESNENIPPSIPLTPRVHLLTGQRWEDIVNQTK